MTYTLFNLKNGKALTHPKTGMVTYPTLDYAKQMLVEIKGLVKEFDLPDLEDQIVILPSDSLRLLEHTQTSANGLHF